MAVLLVMIKTFYYTNTREYTNIPSCRWKLVFDSSRLQKGIFVYTCTLVKLYNKTNFNITSYYKMLWQKDLHIRHGMFFEHVNCNKWKKSLGKYSPLILTMATMMPRSQLSKIGKYSQKAFLFCRR